MRKVLFTSAVLLLCLCACDKAVTIDHHASVEFPLQETLEEVSVLFADEGSADILVKSDGSAVSLLDGFSATALPGGQTLLRYKALALVCGACTDASALLDATFWTEPQLQWVFCLQLTGDASPLADCGFTDCFEARGLSTGGDRLYAGGNAYDKISSLSAEPVSFTIRIREAGL